MFRLNSLITAGILSLLLGLGLAEAADTDATILLKWEDKSSNEEGFNVYKKNPDGSRTKIADTAANIATYTHKFVAPEGSEHCYEVTAWNFKTTEKKESQESNPTNTACATVPFLQIPTPDAPAGLVISVSVSVTVSTLPPPGGVVATPTP
jgi:hypothetical protein